MSDDTIMEMIRSDIKSMKTDIRSDISSIHDKINTMNQDQSVYTERLNTYMASHRPMPQCKEDFTSTLQKEIEDKCSSIEKRKLNKPSYFGWTVILIIFTTAIAAPFVTARFLYNENKERIERYHAKDREENK